MLCKISKGPSKLRYRLEKLERLRMTDKVKRLERYILIEKTFNEVHLKQNNPKLNTHVASEKKKTE